MAFATLSEFAHMDGHGMFVWLAYAIAAVVLFGLVLGPLTRRRRALQRIARRRRAAEKIPQESV